MPMTLNERIEKAADVSALPREFKEVYRYDAVNGMPVKQEVLNEALWASSGTVYARVCERKILYVGNRMACFPAGLRPASKDFEHPANRCSLSIDLMFLGGQS
jgi:hypothetical protein